MKEKSPHATIITRDTVYRIYDEIRERVEARLRHFSAIWEHGADEDIFCELVFCLLTPQSSAHRCGRAVDILLRKNLIFNGCADDICAELNIVRFKNKKSQFIVEARDLFTENGKIVIKDTLLRQGDVFTIRQWLAKNVRGIGYKEASHFLRNIGFGASLAILDRHILKNLHLLGVTDAPPGNLTPQRYLEIERTMAQFSAAIGIPLSHLDFILWYREAGDVFK